MIAARLSNNRFYGWITLAGTLTMLVSMVGNVIASYGVFLPEMCDSLGWSRSALSGPFSLFWVTVGVFSPFAGNLAARFGPKKNIIVGNIILVIGTALMSRVTEVWHVYLIYSVVLAAGQSFGTFIAANALVTNWFYRRRTLAITILSSCGGIGGLLFPPLITYFMTKYGWQNAWLMAAGLHLLLGLVVPILIVRNTPEELGQTPDGDPPAKDGGFDFKLAAAKIKVFQTDGNWEIKNIFRSRSFWMIVAFSAAIMFTFNFISLHMVAYLKDIGYSAMTAATGVSAFNLLNIAGQMGGGILASRIEARYIALVSIVGAALGVFLLFNIEALPTIYLPAVITGLCAGGVQVLTPIMLANYFGRKNYARILGWVTPLITLFSSTSPVLAGFIFDTSGSYRTVFFITFAFLAVGMMGTIFARPPSPKGETEPTRSS